MVKRVMVTLDDELYKIIQASGDSEPKTPKN
jgi:hypothetical protein